MFCLIQFHSCLTKSLLQEPDELSGVVDDTRGSLLMMNFSVEEVEFAIHKLGMRIFYLNCCLDDFHECLDFSDLLMLDVTHYFPSFGPCILSITVV